MKENILVIQTAFIGDAILTLPMIQKLKEMYSDSVIDVISNPNSAEIFNSSSYLDKVIILDKRGKHKSVFSMMKFAKAIKQKKYTKIYSPHRSIRTSLLVMLSGVKETYGFDKSSFPYVYKNVKEHKLGQHEVERNLNLIGANKDNDNWKVLPVCSIPDGAIATIRNYLRNDKDKKYAAVAPGSVWKTKRYPEKYFAEIIKSLIDKSYFIFLIGGKEDKELCDSLQRKFPGSSNSTAGKFNLLESIQLLKNCEILISNDSAPTHLGMCADIPVATIYCSTIPEFGFYPYNSKSTYISYDGLDCKPCGIHGYQECPLIHFNCGNYLAPSEIINHLNEILI